MRINPQNRGPHQAPNHTGITIRTMPIVSAPETMNDTFIQQIVDSARAAIYEIISWFDQHVKQAGARGR